MSAAVVTTAGIAVTTNSVVANSTWGHVFTNAVVASIAFIHAEGAAVDTQDSQLVFAVALVANIAGVALRSACCAGDCACVFAADGAAVVIADLSGIALSADAQATGSFLWRFAECLVTDAVVVGASSTVC